MVNDIWSLTPSFRFDKANMKEKKTSLFFPYLFDPRPKTDWTLADPLIFD